MSNKPNKSVLSVGKSELLDPSDRGVELMSHCPPLQPISAPLAKRAWVRSISWVKCY